MTFDYVFQFCVSEHILLGRLFMLIIFTPHTLHSNVAKDDISHAQRKKFEYWWPTYDWWPTHVTNRPDTLFTYCKTFQTAITLQCIIRSTLHLVLGWMFLARVDQMALFRVLQADLLKKNSNGHISVMHYPIHCMYLQDSDHTLPRTL